MCEIRKLPKATPNIATQQKAAVFILLGRDFDTILKAQHVVFYTKK